MCVCGGRGWGGGIVLEAAQANSVVLFFVLFFALTINVILIVTHLWLVPDLNPYMKLNAFLFIFI